MIEKPKNGRRSASGHRVGAWHQHVVDGDDKVRLARQLRHEKGKTYLEIATDLAVPYFTIRDWVTNRTRIDA